MIKFDVFVFGSNIQGIHGKGAALEAHKTYGAEYGVGEGMTGRAYALPTREQVSGTRLITSLPLHRIKRNVKKFIGHASRTPDVTYLVTAVGCGYAGYKNKDIAPLFLEVPSNCILPSQWQPWLSAHSNWHNLSSDLESPQ